MQNLRGGNVRQFTLKNVFRYLKKNKDKHVFLYIHYIKKMLSSLLPSKNKLCEITPSVVIITFIVLTMLSFHAMALISI